MPASSCPRCGATFTCGADAPEPCACTSLTLDAATLARLRARYVGCLCLRCLRALATADDERRIGDAPPPSSA